MIAFRRLAWTAATLTYLLIVLGAWVRITGSGMGCGDDWPLCHGRLFPPLDDLGTLIEWTHRLVAALLSVFVAGLAGYAWWARRGAGSPKGRGGERSQSVNVAYVALSLLVVQILLGAVTVQLELPHWTVVLHLATAMLLLAALVAAARGWRGAKPERWALWGLLLAFGTVLLGGMTAKLGAASACLGFPLCSGQLIPEGGSLQQLHWTHRLVAYTLTAYAAVWAARERATGPLIVLGLVLLQVTVGALMVLGGLPRGLQALHVTVGTAVWGVLVAVALRSTPAAVPAPTPAPVALR